MPALGWLYLTVSSKGAEPLLRREFELSGDLEEWIRRIEEVTYLKPEERGHRPAGGAPEAGHDWDFRVTARSGGSRELALRHCRPMGEQQLDDPVRTAAAASVTAATTVVAGRTTAPEESA